MNIGYFYTLGNMSEIRSFLENNCGTTLLIMDAACLVAFPSSTTLEGLEAAWQEDHPGSDAIFDFVSEPKDWLATWKERFSDTCERLISDPDYR